MSIRIAIAVVSAAILNTVPGAAQWIQQNSGTINQLEGVHFSDNTTGVVVGDNGTVLTTADGGTTWVQRQSGTDRRLRDVYMADQLTGTAIGDSGTVLRTVDGGITWTQQTATTDLTLLGIHLADADRGFIVGGDYLTGQSVLLYTSNGGETWTQSVTPVDNWFHTVLHDIAFSDSTHGMIAGIGAQQMGDRASGIILHTADAGLSWTVETLDDSSLGFRGIAITDTTAVVVAELGSIYHSTDRGLSWARRADNSNLDTTLARVSFGTALTGTAVGTVFHDDGGWSRPQTHIMRTGDGGATWVHQQVDLEALLSDVCFTNAYHGVIVGSDGLILRTDNGGAPVSALEMTLDSVNFGSVQPATRRDTVLTGILRNAGTADIQITALRLTTMGASAFSLVSLPEFPVHLAPGEQLALSVVFIPNSPGQHRATLTPEGTFPVEPTLHLMGFGSRLTPLVDIGAVQIQASRDTTIAIKNEEDFPLFAAADAITHPRTPFSVVASEPALPAAIAPGDSLRITVRFTPTVLGAIQSRMTTLLRSGDNALYPIDHILSGNGATTTGVDEQQIVNIQTNPSPFHDRTFCSFTLSAPAPVHVEVVDMQGRSMRTWDFPSLAAGSHTIEWNGTTKSGAVCSNGLYWFRITGIGGAVQTLPVAFFR